MTPLDVLVANVPGADALPLAAPVWLFRFLLVLTSVLHLLAMNLLLGGAVLAVVARALGRRPGGDAYGRLAGAIGKLLPVTVAATVTLGVAPLLFLQVLYGRLFFVSSILLGWWWLALVPVLILAYYGTYIAATRVRRGLLIPVAIAVALLAVSSLFTLNMSLMLWPEQFLARYIADPGGWRLDVADAAVPVRWLHFVTAAIAVASLGVAGLGAARRGEDPALSAAAMRLGTRVFAGATLVNIAVGLTWFGLLPAAVAQRFMGGDVVATVLFAVAMLSGLLLGWLAVEAAWRVAPTGRQIATLVVLTAVHVPLMVLVRDQLRAATLARIEYALPNAAPQWEVIAIFGLLLVAGAATVAWMVRAYAAAPPAQARQVTVADQG
jgi:cytochrome bd-type quinol oxidase subunit 1